MKSLDIIKLHNAVFYAYHGALSDEKNLGGKFEIDVELHCELAKAKNTDSLAETVNYEKVYSLMKKVVTERKYNLIEALAHSISIGILQNFEQVQKTVVRVRKPGAPVHGVVDTIEVQIETER
jgi:dihydroneopterin aldolase